MGWTVLYIAFGIVALWLLGEVLLQYKARLRWRLLAFVGFLGVVTGVVLGSVVVIVLGAAAFAVGQTYVTLSFRRGFSMGWALGGRPGASKRRRTDPGRSAAFQEPTLQVSDLEYESASQPFPADPPAHQPDAPAFPSDAPSYPSDVPAFPSDAPSYPSGPPAYEDDEPDAHRSAAPVYEPEPLPEDTGSYGVYHRDGATGPGYGTPSPDTAGYGYPPPGEPAYAPGDTAYAPPAAPAWDAAPAASAPSAGYADGYGYDAYAGHGDRPYADDHQYGYDNGQQYAPYAAADPYAAAPGAPDGGMAGVPGDAQGYGAQPPYDPYGQQGYGYPSEDPYAAPAQDPQPGTPPDGVWMPQQRATEGVYDGDPQAQQPYPYQDGPDGYDPTGAPGYGYGPNEQQYRY